ncbi:MAG: SCO family protein [Alphaproteobacteria bacterium]|nr:SCO family protein [Alphaproteobacteria bacterium]
MFRNRFALIPFLLLVAALAGVVLWREADNGPRLGRVVSSGQIDVGGPFQLIDQNGNKVSDADFRGRYMMIYFGYSFCPDVCPTTLAVMAGALDKLGADASRVVPVFITVDPDRDNPKVLKQYMAAFGPRFVGLTGDHDAIAKAEKEFRVYSKKRPLDPAKPDGNYAMDHSSVIYLIGPDGKMVSYYDEAISPDDLAADIKDKMAGNS